MKIGTFTHQKSNIDTKNCHLKFKGVTFSKPSFWVSMLVFGGVTNQKKKRRPSFGKLKKAVSAGHEISTQNERFF